MSSKTSKIKDKDLLPLFIGYLPEFALKKCKEELNESPERKVKGLQELRALLEKNEKTSGIDFHEDFLVQYLRRNKYRIKDTFQHLHNFVILNKKEVNLFNSVTDHYLETSSSHTILLLPKRCPDGCAVAIFQIATWNPKELPFEHFKQLGVMTFLQLLRDPMNQINGFKFIHDFQGTFSFLKYCTPQNLYLLYNFTINCIPGRYKEIHMINESLAMKTIWNVVKHFLSQKIKDRIYFHSDPEELLDYFPRSILPVKYGGTLEDPGTHDWIKKANKDHEKYSVEGQPNFYQL